MGWWESQVKMGAKLIHFDLEPWRRRKFSFPYKQIGGINKSICSRQFYPFKISHVWRNAEVHVLDL